MHCYFNFHGLKRGKLFFSFKNLATRFFNLEIAWKILLELRQCMNGFVSVKRMLVLKLPPFFPWREGEGKRAAISKQTCFQQKRTKNILLTKLLIISHQCTDSSKEQKILDPIDVECVPLENNARCKNIFAFPYSAVRKALFSSISFVSSTKSFDFFCRQCKREGLGLATQF